MMKRIVTKIGDVFEARLDDDLKKYFQYIADDLTQLNTRVIRVFKTAYPNDASPDLEEVVQGEVDFYAHVIIKFGIQQNLWKKVGKVSDIGKTEDILFRDSRDYGNPPVTISHRWYIWNINESFRYVGKLEGEYQKADIGIVVRPKDIIERMKTGKYIFVYPDY